MNLPPPKGLATGLGSMPFITPAEALDLIWKFMPAVPHWPQLPQLGQSEGLIAQTLRPLIDCGILAVREDQAAFDLDHPLWPENLTQFYSHYLAAEAGDPEALEQFSIPEASARGLYAFCELVRQTDTDSIRYLKGHVVGPLTMGFQLKDTGGRIAYYNPELRDLIVKTLAMNAKWQAAELRRLGRPAIIFIDDPTISACGSSSHITLTREMIIDDLNAILSAVHSENAYTGIHSCDALDWTILFESGTNIVSLDAYQFGDSLIPYVSEMDRFLKRGGTMAWGIVPTRAEAFEETTESLIDRLNGLWTELESRGIDRKRLLSQSLITPACGTGLLSPDLAVRIYQLTAEISGEIHAMANSLQSVNPSDI